jgi:hypothetical protein
MAKFEACSIENLLNQLSGTCTTYISINNLLSHSKLDTLIETLL